MLGRQFCNKTSMESIKKKFFCQTWIRILLGYQNFLWNPFQVFLSKTHWMWHTCSSTGIAQSATSWIDDYFSWINSQGQIPCCRIHSSNGHFCPSTGMYTTPGAEQWKSMFTFTDKMLWGGSNVCLAWCACSMSPMTSWTSPRTRADAQWMFSKLCCMIYLLTVHSWPKFTA